MGTTSSWTVILGLTAALTLLGGVSGAVAEEDPWDQEEAVKLAKQLADQVGDIRVTMKKAAPGTVGITKQRQFRLEEDLRLMRNSTRHLARQLEAGKGREETLPTAQRVGMFIRDARVTASGWTPPKWIETKIDSARNTLSDLAALYGAELADVFRGTPGPGAGSSP
jgi:hypothetical protein